MPEKFGSVFYCEASAKQLRNDSQADTADSPVKTGDEITVSRAVAIRRDSFISQGRALCVSA
jgi:hypothetical protein